MNKCFFIGNVVKTGDFKFILNKKMQHKSKMHIIVKLIDGNYIKAVAYDDTADYIFRNNYNNSLVCIQGKLEQYNKEVYAIVKYIEKI